MPVRVWMLGTNALDSSIVKERGNSPSFDVEKGLWTSGGYPESVVAKKIELIALFDSAID